MIPSLMFILSVIYFESFRFLSDQLRNKSGCVNMCSEDCVGRGTSVSGSKKAYLWKGQEKKNQEIVAMFTPHAPGQGKSQSLYVQNILMLHYSSPL